MGKILKTIVLFPLLILALSLIMKAVLIMVVPIIVGVFVLFIGIILLGTWGSLMDRKAFSKMIKEMQK